MGALIREYRVFPSGNTFKATQTINNISDGTTVTVTDEGPFYSPPLPDSSFDYCLHSFVFWNAKGSISTSNSVTVTVKGSTVVTSWYQYGCSPGGGPPAITTYAFDANANSVMAGVTPIGSVTPSGSWTSPSTTVTPSSSGNVTIDAKNSISGKPFIKWLIYGAGAQSADDVIIPPNGGGFYVAVYYKDSSVAQVFDVDILEQLTELVHKIDEIDWVVDPFPLDRARLALLTAEVSTKSASARADPAKLSAADSRKELTRVKADIKELEAREKELEAGLKRK